MPVGYAVVLLPAYREILDMTLMSFWMRCSYPIFKPHIAFLYKKIMVALVDSVETISLASLSWQNLPDESDNNFYMHILIKEDNTLLIFAQSWTGLQLSFSFFFQNDNLDMAKKKKIVPARLDCFSRSPDTTVSIQVSLCVHASSDGYSPLPVLL